MSMIPNLRMLTMLKGLSPSPTNPDSSTIQNDQSDNPESDDLMSKIMELFNPKHQQIDKLTANVNAQPSRSDFKPSRMRIIGSALAGLGAGGPAGIVNGQPVGYKSNIPEGLNIQSALMNQPFNQATNDWKNKNEPLGDLAKLENQSNTQDRLIGGQLLSEESRKRTNERIAAKDRTSAELTQQKIDISRERADAYVKAKQFTSAHPAYKSFTDENGDLYFYNPTDPKAEPIPSGLKGLSAQEKIDLNVQGRLKEIEAQSNANQNLEDTKQGNRLELQANKPVKPTKPAAVPKPPSETQNKVGLVNKANQIISQYPELKPYIIFDKSTGVSVVPSGIMHPFTDETKRKRAYDLLFGSDQSNNQTGSKPTGKVMMISPDGKTKGYIPAEQLEAAKKQGYTEAK